MNAIALTDNELLELEDCERTVEFGVGMLVAAGRALAKIRDKRLYRATHATWDDYTSDRWRHLFSDKGTADRMITFAAVHDHLTPFGVELEHESHAREIAKLAPDIWQATAQVAMTAADIEGKPVTASHFKYAGREVSDMLIHMSRPADTYDDARIKEMAVNVVDERLESTKQRIQRDNPNRPSYAELLAFVQQIALCDLRDIEAMDALIALSDVIDEARQLVGE